MTYLLAHYRKQVETAGSQIERLLPKHIHAVTADGFELKTIFADAWPPHPVTQAAIDRWLLQLESVTRTPIGRSHKGSFKHLRPDDLLAHALRAAMAQVPNLDPKAVEDVICGCAIPEGQQGLNVARIGAILAGLPNSVGGITVNRFCASGLSAVQMAADRIRVGEA